MTEITLRWTSNNDLTSAVIRAATWSDWSHVECMWSPDKTLGAQLNGGVKIRNASETELNRYMIGTIECTEQQLEDFALFLHNQLRKPYDLTGVIGLGLHRDWHQGDKWWCSELQCCALQHAGLIPNDRLIHANRCTPGDLLWFPEIKVQRIVSLQAAL